MSIYHINNNILFNKMHREVSSLDNPESKITLSVSSCKLLSVLISRINNIVDKQTLVEEIWMKQGVVVTENSLYQTVLSLRKNLISLGEDKNIINNVPKLGYILRGEVKYLQQSIAANETCTPLANFDDDVCEKEQIEQANPFWFSSLFKMGWLIALSIVTAICFLMPDNEFSAAKYTLIAHPHPSMAIYKNEKVQHDPDVEQIDSIINNPMLSKLFEQSDFDALYFNGVLAGNMNSYFLCKGMLEDPSSRCASVLLVEETAQ